MCMTIAAELPGAFTLVDVLAPRGIVPALGIPPVAASLSAARAGHVVVELIADGGR